MWLIILSDQLTIVALVGHYLTNKLMVRGPIRGRKLASRGHRFTAIAGAIVVISGISSPFELLSPFPG